MGSQRRTWLAARVLRRGRHIAFIAAELRTNDRLIATATVTKSIRQRA
jgi:acyl-coenzyme A thioesterase PaaI-like protein